MIIDNVIISFKIIKYKLLNCIQIAISRSLFYYIMYDCGLLQSSNNNNSIF